MAVLSCLAISGCSICAPGYLNDYAGVGGKWPRADLENGRVGSAFSDPGSLPVAASQEVIVPADEFYSDDAPDEVDDEVLRFTDADGLEFEDAEVY